MRSLPVCTVLKKTRSPQCGRCGRGGAPAPAGNLNFWPPRPREIRIFGPRARGKFRFLAPAPAASAGVRASRAGN